MGIRRLWHGCLLMVVLGLVAGCVPPAAQDRVTAFSGATKVTIESVRNAFQTVDDAYIETRTEEAIYVIASGKKINPKDVAKPFLDHDVLQARLDVLDQVSSYADLLASLVGTDNQEELDAKVDQFSSSLKSVASNDVLQKAFGTKNSDGTFNPVLSDKDRGILATALNEMARIMIGVKTRHAVQDAVQEMDPNIKTICELLRKDIGESRRAPGLRSALYHSYEKQLADRFRWIAAHSAKLGAKSNASLLSPLEQRDEIRAWLRIVKDQETADTTMEGIYRSLGQLAKTHGQLYQAFEKTSPSLDESIKMLRREADYVRNRYKALSSAE